VDLAGHFAGGRAGAAQKDGQLPLEREEFLVHTTPAVRARSTRRTAFVHVSTPRALSGS
jgi:hypothetical protein